MLKMKITIFYLALTPVDVNSPRAFWIALNFACKRAIRLLLSV